MSRYCNCTIKLTNVCLCTLWRHLVHQVLSIILCRLFPHQFISPLHFLFPRPQSPSPYNHSPDLSYYLPPPHFPFFLSVIVFFLPQEICCDENRFVNSLMSFKCRHFLWGFADIWAPSAVQITYWLSISLVILDMFVSTVYIINDAYSACWTDVPGSWTVFSCRYCETRPVARNGEQKCRVLSRRRRLPWHPRHCHVIHDVVTPHRWRRFTSLMTSWHVIHDVVTSSWLVIVTSLVHHDVALHQLTDDYLNQFKPFCCRISSFKPCISPTFYSNSDLSTMFKPIFYKIPRHSHIYSVVNME